MLKEKYGPWAVIVGGSEGIGACFATQLAEQGFNLVLIARKPDPLRTLKDEIGASFDVEVRTLALDITSDEMLAKVAAATDDVEVGLLIYNAGSSSPKPFLDSPLSDALHTIRLNPIGQISLAHHFGQKMRQRGKGGMIFMGSLAGAAGGAGHAAYCASKAFTQVLAESLWAELAPAGIDVLGLIIAATMTPFMERSGFSRDALSAASSDAATAQQAGSDNEGPPAGVANIPFADPADIARIGLENIGNGPIQLPPELAEAFAYLAGAPRAEASLFTSKGIAAMKFAEPSH